MTPKEKLVTVREGASWDEIRRLLHKHRIEKVLVVNGGFELRGLVTVKDIQKAREYPDACKDEHEQLRAGAAVSTGPGTDERVEALVGAGVDVIVVDTAHGHSQGVVNRVRSIKQHFPDMQVVAGNVATAEGAQALVQAGCDAVKVGDRAGLDSAPPGSWPESGVPQLSAIDEVSRAIPREPRPGHRRRRGPLLRRCCEGPRGRRALGDGGQPVRGHRGVARGGWSSTRGRSYKSYRGMGSLGAMGGNQGSKDRYFQDTVTELDKLVPEGIEGRVPYKGPLAAIIGQLVGGAPRQPRLYGFAGISMSSGRKRGSSASPARGCAKATSTT